MTHSQRTILYKESHYYYHPLSLERWCLISGLDWSTLNYFFCVCNKSQRSPLSIRTGNYGGQTASVEALWGWPWKRNLETTCSHAGHSKIASCWSSRWEEKTFGQLKKRFYWPGYSCLVRNWCRTCICHVCNKEVPRAQESCSPSDCSGWLYIWCRLWQ